VNGIEKDRLSPTNDRSNQTKSVNYLFRHKNNNLKTKEIFAFLLLLGLILNLLACSKDEKHPKHFSVQIIRKLPHNTNNFTQGLFYHDGKLFESTGIECESTIQKIDVDSGKVEDVLADPPGVFAEGLALLGRQLFQLTWLKKLVYVYDFDQLFNTDFSNVRTLNYPFPIREGWGLTAYQSELIMSDGSSYIYFLDPHSFEIKRKIQVRKAGDPVQKINELEYAQNKIFANIWQRNEIIQIDATSGEVMAVIDASRLEKPARDYPNEKSPRENVLNGIAYNQTTDTFYLTGKRWQYIFEVKFVED